MTEETIPCPRCTCSGLRSGRLLQPEGPPPARLCVAEHADGRGPRYHCTEFTHHNVLVNGEVV
jgi:hypothetical protein